MLLSIENSSRIINSVLFIAREERVLHRPGLNKNKIPRIKIYNPYYEMY